MKHETAWGDRAGSPCSCQLEVAVMAVRFDIRTRFGLLDRSHLQGVRVGQPLRGDLVSRDHLRTPRCSSVVRVIRCCASALSMRLSLPEGRSRREPQPARG